MGVARGYRDGGGQELPGWDLQVVTRMDMALGWPGVTRIGVARGYWDGGGQGLPGWSGQGLPGGGWPGVPRMGVGHLDSCNSIPKE